MGIRGETFGLSCTLLHVPANEAANEAGGRDNISVLLVEVGDVPEKKGLIARLLGKVVP